MADVVARIDGLMQAQKRSKRGLARHLGITPQSVNGWYHAGKRPSRELIPAIAEYLETSADYLLGVVDDAAPEAPHLSSEDADVLDQLDHIAGLIADLRSRISARAISPGAAARPASPTSQRGGPRPRPSRSSGVRGGGGSQDAELRSAMDDALGMSESEQADAAW